MGKTERAWQELDLKWKIGQLFVCGFDGLSPSAGIERLIGEYGIGGVVYFRRNLRDAKQAAALSAQLQSLSSVPLLTAVDQEGGMVVRLEEGVAVMPGAMAVGAAGNPELTYEAAFLAGRELRSIGINLNFAPCLDVNNNPENPVIGVRSYGENPEAVAALGVQALRGYQDGGVAAAAKHFPGHGDTTADSHRELPVVPHGRDRLDAVELLPFRAAIAAGVDAIMTAHVVFPAYEPDGTPATLSRRILTGLLRERLAFRGVVVTDCLEMNAIAGTIGVARGAVEAVKGGADLVLVSHRLDRQIAALEAVHEAVLAGEIPLSRIDEAVDRVWRLKEKRGLLRAEAETEAESEVRRDAAGRPRGAAESAGEAAASRSSAPPASGIPVRTAADDAAARLSEAAVTVVKGEALLPLPREKRVLAVWAEARVGTEVVEAIEQERTLGAALREEGYAVAELRIGLDPTAAEREAVLREAETAETVVFASYDAAFHAGQAALANELCGRPDNAFVLAAVRTPYDLSAVPDAPLYICAYENKPAMMAALAGVLAGRLPAGGVLPVTVGAYPAGRRG